MKIMETNFIVCVNLMVDVKARLLSQKVIMCN